MYHTSILSKYVIIDFYSLGLWGNVSHLHLVKIWMYLFLLTWVMGLCITLASFQNMDIFILINSGYGIIDHTCIFSKFEFLCSYSLGLWENVSHQQLVKIWIYLFVFTWVMRKCITPASYQLG